MDWGKWPCYDVEHEEAVRRVIRSGQLFAAHEVQAFESQYARYLGVNYVRGVGNATQGLHLALAAAGVGVGHEVIVTTYSWISTASVILMQNAVPIFCDMDRKTLGIDVARIENLISRRTRAVIVTHMLGFQADIVELARLCRENNLILIEDASHAHGASLFGRKLGTFGDMSVFSLHQRKALSVGDGGIVCTDSEEYASQLYRLRSFGAEELSYNYRMSEFAAALGSVGIKRLDDENRQRRESFFVAQDAFAGSRSLSVCVPLDVDGAAHYAIALEVHANVPKQKVDNFLSQCAENGIPIRKTWQPLHRHPHFNPSREPARGLPWKLLEYRGANDRSYLEEDHPIANEMLPDRLLELYAHPGTKPCAIYEVAELAAAYLS